MTLLLYFLEWEMQHLLIIAGGIHSREALVQGWGSCSTFQLVENHILAYIWPSVLVQCWIYVGEGSGGEGRGLGGQNTSTLSLRISCRHFTSIASKLLIKDPKCSCGACPQTPQDNHLWVVLSSVLPFKCLDLSLWSIQILALITSIVWHFKGSFHYSWSIQPEVFIQGLSSREAFIQGNMYQFIYS